MVWYSNMLPFDSSNARTSVHNPAVAEFVFTGGLRSGQKLGLFSVADVMCTILDEII